MGLWKMHEIYDDAWEQASSTKQGREDAIKNSDIIPKEDFWQPGEWGQWVRREKDLKAKRQAAMYHRRDAVYQQIKEVIEKGYEPGKGETAPSPDAIACIARNLTTMVVTFSCLPPEVLAVTAEEKLQVFKRDRYDPGPEIPKKIVS